MARMPRMKLVHGPETELPEGEPIGSVLPPDAIAARVDGELRDLSFVPTSDATVEAVEASEEDGLHVLRHSTAHVMAQAVCDLHPGARYAIGPAIEDGFYYDFELAEPLSSDDLPAIEARMRELVAADVAVRPRGGRTGRGARASGRSAIQGRDHPGSGRRCRRGRSGGGDSVTLYRNGDWADLCLGPHVPSTGRLGAFRLTNVAGAYWRGDEQRPMLTRVYGTAWATEEDLDAYLPPPGRGREARPSQARAAARPVLLARRARAGAGIWHPRGGCSARNWRTTSAISTWSAGTTWS